MKDRLSATHLTFTLALLLACASAASSQSVDHSQGVYQYVVRNVDATVPDVANAIKDAAANAGWTVAGVVDVGSPAECAYQSRVLVLLDAEYAGTLLRANRLTGPFAVLDRVNVFDDEEGVHVSIVNPLSANRTVLMNDTGYQDFFSKHVDKLRQLIRTAVVGTESDRQYGQIREKSLIGKTMGVMAGGRYDGKVNDLALIPDESWEQVAEWVEPSLTEQGAKWGTVLSYRVDLPEFETVIFGTTGTPLDSKSFEIVGAGSDDERKDFACPGIAHAAAYPIEIVVASADEGSAVRMVDAMFRMKMYFEDAGNWAFMKNMTMPGSIADELKAKLDRAMP